MILTAKTLQLLMIAGRGRQFKTAIKIRRGEWVGVLDEQKT